MEGKIVLILFAVLVLGLVIYSVQSGFWGKVWEPINGIFSYKTAHWFSDSLFTLDHPSTRHNDSLRVIFQ